MAIASQIVKKRKKAGLNTSSGLYNLAVQSGLRKDADRILANQKGEEVKKIFSGGFISDIFDVLNSLQYGVVGTLKGKGFLEGVRTRQSWSDKDALGDNGIPGVVAGIVLDIVSDPLTYIPPAAIVKRVPIISKLAKGAKELVFGKRVTKVLKEIPEQKLTQLYQDLEGGTKAGKYLADKFAWMFGVDPIHKETIVRGTKNVATGTMGVIDTTKGTTKLTSEMADKLGTIGKDGRVYRTTLDVLKKVFSPEDYKIAKEASDTIKKLSYEQVDLGMISREIAEKNIDTYFQNNYMEFLKPKEKGLFGFKRLGVSAKKARVEGLTPEKMKELGQVTDMPFLYMKTAVDMKKDIETVKIFNELAKVAATAEALPGFVKLPTTQRLFTSATGEKIQMLSKVKNLNKDLKPVFKELRRTFKADKTTLSEISRLEKELGNLGGLRIEEFNKFFQEGRTITKEVAKRGVKTGVPVIEKLPKDLFDIAQGIKKGSYDELKLEKLFQEGVLERNGFKSVDDFVDYIKKPAEVIPAKTIEKTAKGNLDRLINLQKQIENLVPKATKLRAIDKRSIDDSYRFLEDTISKITAEKEGLIEQIGKVKLGELSGKYVPEYLAKYIDEISEPAKFGIGKRLVAEFKFAKVVMNPATNARNIASNKVLNWWKLDMNPLDPRVWKTEATATKEIFKKGGEWTTRATKHGYGLDTMASNEIIGLLDDPQMVGFGSKMGKKWAQFKKTFGGIYQGEENQTKLSAFIFNVKHKGMTDEAAWKAAESATFNYAQVTPFVRRLRTSLFGLPFITFTLKATPVAIETAYKAPGRISVFGKIKNAIESQTDQEELARERAAEPPWIKDGFYIKLPMKDKHGRSAYFDLTYIIPFGDMVSGQFFERQVGRETGTKESIPVSALRKSPALNFLMEVGRNQDFYGNKLWKDSDPLEKQTGDLMRHLTKTFMPPPIADQIPGGYNKSGERQYRGFVGATTSAKGNQRRTLMEEMLRHVGAKIQPIDADIQETYQKWNSQKALQSLLREQGETKELNIPYIPKP